ncbi:DUF1553 domain-containing protein [Acidobacteria bacterium AH-259-G07]|nr:DUF1553 domain-containing protein [Acidobacteria bacterium AH-259-G07]
MATARGGTYNGGFPCRFGACPKKAAKAMSRCFSALIFTSWLTTVVFGTPAQESGQTVDFQRYIRPILADNCFQCHGPDDNTRKVGLRLDIRQGLFAQRDNGAPIVPGDLEASLLYKRVTSNDPMWRMPYGQKPLTKIQISLIKRWIQEGGSWDQHWSFQALKRPPLPDFKKREWVRKEIDRLILARLEAEGLEPSPEADRRTLIRRVSLDLTGLPPTPEEVDDFVNDSSKKAYEKLVDRLLESPHWGEHRARYWLDAARYADTHGLHIDNYREIWPYRDWVISAFNKNLSFKQFTIEQIAGDLLPNPTLEKRIATGFHRCNVTTNEGGVIVEEVEAMYAQDRAETTGAVWLGLTLGCASCHNHKFDPISRKDFYSMTAFFRNATQHALDLNISDTPPVVVVPRQEDRARWKQLEHRPAELESHMQKIQSASDSKIQAWLATGEYRALHLPLDASSELLSLSIDEGAEARLKDGRQAIELSEGATLGETADGNRKALRFEGESWAEIPTLKYVDTDKPFSITVWLYQPDADGNFAIASQSDPDDNGRGWSLTVNSRTPRLVLVGGKEDSISISAYADQKLEVGTWNHLAVSYDGSGERAGLNLFFNGQSLPTLGSEYFAKLKGSIRTDKPILLGKLSSEESQRYFAGGAIADFRIFNRTLTAEEARLVSLWSVLESARTKQLSQLTAQEREALKLYYFNLKDRDYREVLVERGQVDLERREIRRRGAVTHVMQERMDTAPSAHILYRGMYDQPRAKVQANVPAALPPMPGSFPRNRLGLAKWLVHDSNPLTPRVTVNRFWQEVFGTGIVKTTEDFGSQGEPASHPKLLDWLAVEFRDSGWNVKQFFKMMVMSATYRQSAGSTGEKLARDPQNRLLSRGPRFRMAAEMVRDYALAASGLLVREIGGPSVKPYQPDSIWEVVAMPQSNTRFYERDTGRKLYRRSLYTFWKRAAPPPSMGIFNAPTRENCTVRRERTNTPLQALVTMNDPQFVEASRHLAEKTMREAGQGLDQRVDYMTMRLIARPFDKQERTIARQAYNDYLAYYDSNIEDARKLLKTGESKPDQAFPVDQFAALTMLANLIMNLDEVLNK